jgi:hypothetical protein
MTPAASSSPTPTASVSATWGELGVIAWEPPEEKSFFGVEGAQIVIGVGIPVGAILIVGFGVLMYRYRRALRAEMRQSLKSTSVADASDTGMGV